MCTTGSRCILSAGLAVLAVVASGAGGRAGRAECAPGLSSGYVDRVRSALAAKQDVWGNALLRSPSGPTYDGAKRYLTPLLYARTSRGRKLTESGVYYLPFAQPLGAYGAGSVMLHVADGSAILAERADGRRLVVGVGEDGRERYGSCLGRLTPARLADGYLPILETGYVDAHGVRYRQESFAARTGDELTSYIRLAVESRTSAARIRLGSLTYVVPPGSVRIIYAAWAAARVIDEPRYSEARRALVAYWQARLAEGASFDVPERRVLDAERNLLIQNLELTWRYSIGNPYEEFSFPESIDGAEVMAEYGFGDVAASILRTSLGRRPTPYPNWKMGEKLLGSALYYRLFADRSYVEQVTPVLARYVAALGGQIDADPRGLLQRERYSSDIPDQVYGLHSQAVVWQGLRSMGQVWAAMGEKTLAARCRRLSTRLESGLRRAVSMSQRRLGDGSLFVPVRLLDGERPYDSVTESREGSYWNLVAPYAFASGFFAPRSTRAIGIGRYLLRHGSRFLGLVRAGAYSLYRQPAYPTSGSDQVYGLNAARFLADNDEADQLVLSLYGQLAAGMTPETFVAGEGATIAPLAGQYYRAMYLPPNSISNAAFLETLRLMLVHEPRGPRGEPRGLELAYATPRAWLRPGRRIAVRKAPTSFGPLSYSIEAHNGSVDVSLDVPNRSTPHALSLRLRLPRGERMTSVLLEGRPYRRFDATSQTIDLTGRSGAVSLIVHYQ